MLLTAILLMSPLILGLTYTRKKELELQALIRQKKRTRDLDEKELGIDATNWIKAKLDGAIMGMTILLSALNLLVVWASMVAFSVGCILEMQSLSERRNDYSGLCLGI